MCFSADECCGHRAPNAAQHQGRGPSANLPHRGGRSAGRSGACRRLLPADHLLLEPAAPADQKRSSSGRCRRLHITTRRARRTVTSCRRSPFARLCRSLADPVSTFGKTRVPPRAAASSPTSPSRHRLKAPACYADGEGGPYTQPATTSPCVPEPGTKQPVDRAT